MLLLLQDLYLQQQYPWKCKSLTLKEVVMESVEQGKELAVLDPMMAALQRLLNVGSRES